MCDFIFEHRERQRKKHFCLLRCLSAFATPIKLYFRCVFKLLPYVALALGKVFFYSSDFFLYGLLPLENGIKADLVSSFLLTMYPGVRHPVCQRRHSLHSRWLVQCLGSYISNCRIHLRRFLPV